MITGRRHTWAQMFGVGLALWLLTVVVTFLTANPTLVPTLVLLGSFLVPASFVAWAFERLGTHRELYGLAVEQLTPAAFKAARG